MKILIIGSGAREHAITEALKRSSRAPRLYCCGTSLNPGIEACTEHYRVGDITDRAFVVKYAGLWNVDMAIIGPEVPLEKGLTDALQAFGIDVIGPTQQLAQIESSKTFARNLMRDHAIAGLPLYKEFSNREGITEFLEELGPDSYVVKANGLMAGKGVKVAGDHLHSYQEALDYCEEIFAQGQSLLIEEKLIGQEFSFMCFSDGTTVVPMPLVQDHKRAFEEDKGPNTGGMGSYSAPDHSLPFLDSSDVAQAWAINQAVLKALMTATGQKYVGILYGGFIATSSGIYVIEFNARFGDPEALNVLSILESDFVELCLALTKGSLDASQVQFSPKATVCKYAVPQGYPDHPLKQVEIGIDAVHDKATLYLAAVDKRQDKLYATGSRTVAYVGVADSLVLAERLAEQEISRIEGPVYHRKDIGTSELINQRISCMQRLRAL